MQLYREVDTAKLRRKDRGREKSMAIVQPKQYGERAVPSGVADIELLQQARARLHLAPVVYVRAGSTGILKQYCSTHITRGSPLVPS